VYLLVDSVEIFISTLKIRENMAGIEDEILEYLKQGLSPKEIIEMGYKKSTVYKVYQKFKALTCKLQYAWKIEDIKISPKKRFLPGEYVTISGYFKNTSDRDFYLYRIGIQPEWLIKDNEWFAREIRQVIKPGERKFVSFRMKIPKDIPFGEYELRFGVEGQYLMTGEPPKFSWAEPPVILHVKHPVWLKVFISHSSKDLSLIRLLEKSLDNYGVQAIIAEDLQEPGVDLWQKITREINNSDVVLAILTENAVRSKWVKMELEYAQKIRKPIIPLKEKSVELVMPIEWIEFSKDDDPELIFGRIMEALKIAKYRYAKPYLTGVLASLLLGFILGGFFIGLGLAGSKKA